MVDWPRVRVLRLVATGLQAPALEVLARWPGLSQLRTLDLRGNDLGDDGKQRLRAAGLPAEERLIVEGETA